MSPPKGVPNANKGKKLGPRKPPEGQEHATIRKDRTKARKPGTRNKVPATPENQTRTKGPICGAKRKPSNPNGPGICLQPAGAGTDHLGFGHCKYHGGSTPAGETHAYKQKIAKDMPTYGGPITVGPHEAILQEVHRTAGHVQWLHEMIQWLGRTDDSVSDEELERIGILPEGNSKNALTQITLQGIKPSVWLEMYHAERRHLVNTCSQAVKMGCAERTVQIAEDQGKMIAMVVLAIFRDTRLGMTSEQIGIFPQIAREHLAKANGASPIQMPQLTIEAAAIEVQ